MRYAYITSIYIPVKIFTKSKVKIHVMFSSTLSLLYFFVIE